MTQKTTLTPDKVDIEVDCDKKYENLIMTMDTGDRIIKAMMTPQEAQMFYNMLGEAITAMLLHKLEIKGTTH